MRARLLCCLAALLAACTPFREPVQPTAATLLARAPAAWSTDSTAHFHVHIQRGSAAEPLLPVVAARLERDLRRVLDVLGEPDYDTRIDAFVVPSPADMQRLVGTATNGVAYYRTNVIGLVVTPNWSASATHELLHVVAMNRWGRGETWLNEGLAVHAADEWRGSDVHEAARRLRGSDEWVPLRRLIANFRAHEPRVAYPIAGSFVRYLYELYGREKLQQLWRGGADRTKPILGKSVRQLERDWQRMLAADTLSGLPSDP